MLDSSNGVRCHLPTQNVFQPCSASTSLSSAVSNGMRPLQLGNPSVNSSMVAIPTLVALRPVNSDARVGEHSAVVWNCDSRTPRSAIRLIVGISTNPPKQSQVAIPVSSQTR